MKKRSIFIIFFLMLLLLFVGGYLKINKIIKHPFKGNEENVIIKVKNGETLYSVLDSLNEKKAIENEYVIKWYIKKYNLDTVIKPGSYTFVKEISLDNFIKDLNSGKYNENAIKVTIPEGYNIEQIGKVLEDKGIITKENFLVSCKEYNLPQYIKRDGSRKYALEGYLFPDTYNFEKNMQGKAVIDMMLKQFEAILNDIQKKNNKNLSNEDIDRSITLASIVEREADKDADKPKIASVFYNRLSKKMPLQSDVTVLYAYGVTNINELSADGILHYNKLSIQSPYNTYYVNTLPAGPICNPGRISIEAAINPDKTSFYYFVATKDGVFFSQTMQEHDAIVKKYNP